MPTKSASSKCIICKTKISGRVDKKFCSDYCRSRYHNHQNADSSNFMRRINNILRKNRRILASLNPKGKAKASKTQLLDKGFKFNYYTNVYVTKAGKEYKFCYDQGYLALANNQFAIVERLEYVD